ncbi:MAG: HD domain-containing protein [Desulfobacula sp.]|uniref:HD domain-containing phosphohydrolase n=1 Tax=Desulfobacula sp. TaxID=2593537 RepID=UPI0025B9DF13|nr:HD domain-containing phosphohydrolase [Desulfobacula sp.]MCD4720300.1 HD domain-containing protein [Desulfobacula sp.]
MKIGGSFFRSKVAQRIFFLFILCAMLPVIVLSFLSYTQVSKQLKSLSLNRLKTSVKAHGMSIYERFLFLETNMQMIASGDFKDNKYLPEIYSTDDFNKKILQRFEGLALIKTSKELNLLYGRFKDLPNDFIDKALTIGDDKTTLVFKTSQNRTPAKVYMLIKTIPDNTGIKVLVGEINISYLWGIGHDNILPRKTDLCIVDQVRKVLITSFPPTDDLLHQVTVKIDGTTPLAFKYKDGENTYFASYWPMFLKSRFDAPSLNVILRSNSSDALVPLSNFKKTFPLVLLLSLWIVLLLSIIHIRKSLVPLEKLKEGTRRVAKQDFKNRVIVTSHDEFEDLADSFNSMSEQLDQHFVALSTRADIDRAILSSLDTKKIIYTVLKRMFIFFSCDSISVNLAVEKQPNTFHAYISTDIKVRKPFEEFFRITPEDKEILSLNSKHLIVHTKKNKPGFLSKADNRTGHLFLVLPLFFDGVLKGTIALGYSKEKSFSDNDLKHAHQMADQMMVALSNSSLVEDLEKLNIGTLEALARAVDAKSAWTAGHSERVTDLSLKIAKVMGFTTEELEVLRRAAYLHDIGKIGVPLAILDKPGKLNDEEFNKIKDHPLIGLRILEPISAYEDVLPMVSQHHEKFNGKGYPYGLSGEDIALGARILAVADVYDAVVSDRPYRDGWVEEKAIKMITEESGKHFDPKVVNAFLAAI